MTIGTRFYLLACGFCAVALLNAQDIPQPTLQCGPGSLSTVPRNLSVLHDTAIANKADRVTARLRVQLKDSAVELEVPGFFGEMEQVCEVAPDRLLVFGILQTPPFYNVVLLDHTKGILLDSFPAFKPMLSPDKRWLILRRFYAMRVGDGSDEYLVYDLRKSAAANRSRPEDAAHPGYLDAAGAVVYPVEEDGRAVENPIGLPEEERHTFRSNRFYWSSGSKTVVFADEANGVLSVVLASVDEKCIQTSVHAVSVQDLLGPSEPGAEFPYVNLSDAVITSLPNGAHEVYLSFSTGFSNSGPYYVTLRSNDFEPAKPLTRPPPRPLKRAIPKKIPAIEAAHTPLQSRTILLTIPISQLRAKNGKEVSCRPKSSKNSWIPTAFNT
jgi:hypothetical protein